ncbi:MAG: hypothetical protein KJO69_01175, partial [Gammaproteobacteria bacterium]|nr:hypothetical protein [Gammaproteobacteria bacterium]
MFSKQTLPKYWLIVFFVLACLLNYFHIPLFSGTDLIFGNSIAIVVLLYFGLLPALTISILASLVTILIWTVPINTIPMAMEILVIHWALSRNRSALLYGVIYWATLGWILVYFLVYLVSDLPEFSNRAIVIKYAFNGILAILFGFVLARLFGSITGISTAQNSRNVSQILSYQLFMLVAIVLSIVAISGLRFIQAQRLDDIDNYLELKAATANDRIESHVQQHQKALEIAKSLLLKSEDKSEIQNILVNLKDTYPSILTLLAADKDGNILVTAPESLLKAARADDVITVVDRSYFNVPKAQLKPFVSEVFQGRGFGDDVIVALSTPILKDEKFDGIIEASLNLQLFSELDTHLLDDLEGLLLFDKQNRVIYASEHYGYQFLEDLTDSRVLQWIIEPQSYFSLTKSGHNFIGKHQIIDALEWQVVVGLPRAYYENTIANYMLVVVLTLVLTLILIFYLSEYISRVMTKPIRALSKRLSDAAHPEDLDLADFETQNIRELIEVTTRLQEFSERSKATLAALAETNIAKEHINQELKTLNDNLETIVTQKTADLNTALDDANQANQAKSDFLANMSHEIRTPMNGILGILDLLIQSDVNSDQKEFLRLAQNSANSLLVLINDILDLSKVESGKLEVESIPFSMFETVDDSVAFYSSHLQNKKLQISFNTKHDSTICLGDPNRVRQIINNLLSNAIKFTSEGRVNISLNSSTENGHITYTLEVSDTGIGIAADKVDELFDSFTQADSSTTRLYGGTGLGLAICKRLAELMNGTIKAESQIGEGTTFTVR